jgi:hypothetical protein
MSDDAIRRAAERVAQGLADQGKLIEAGWQVYRSLALRDITSNREIDRYREAFMSGASHLFTAMLTFLEPGTEETEADLRRMDRLHAEIEPHENMLRVKYGWSAGRA